MHTRSAWEQQIRERLIRRLDQLGARSLAERRASATDSVLRDEIGDEVDQAERDRPRDLELRLSERDALEAQQIEAALERMDRGEYGLCTVCGQCIEPRRLELVPTTPFCAEDAERIERERAGTPPAMF